MIHLVMSPVTHMDTWTHIKTYECLDVGTIKSFTLLRTLLLLLVVLASLFVNLLLSFRFPFWVSLPL